MKIAVATSRALPLLTDDDRPLLSAFARCGADAQPVCWDAPDTDWTTYDRVVLRSCWDYHLRPAEFSEWVSRLRDAGVRLLNPPALVTWNMDKRYLASLEGRGVALPPTRWLERGAHTSLADVFAESGWSDVVIKPSISASATDTWRVRASNIEEMEPVLLSMLNRGEVMIQRFVNEIISDGELSMVFIDGEFSHAASKRPSAGDFRVQSEHGGVSSMVTPPAGIIAEGARIAALLPQPWLYVRIDGVVVAGAFQLMEAECIEPYLYFSTNPVSYTRFAEAACR